ncbi:MAG TPA: hypothetical protein VHM29_03585, partial [Acidimicrobiia bacterium]|nr:hypothetical protein [Acidimicrobiia bacterium]
SSQIQAKNKKNQSMLQNKSINGTSPPFSFRWRLETPTIPFQGDATYSDMPPITQIGRILSRFGRPEST